MKNKNISTKTPITWCPGCPNYMILAGVKNFLSKRKDIDKYAIVTGIGCHAKMFDYVNLPGINSLHGRVPPTCLGLKVGNPNLKVLGFSGDGDAFAEGISHTLHAARYNSDWTYVVHNNQIFALTVGEPTPLTEQGFADKTVPNGVKVPPLNSIKMMIDSGATFVARVWADVKQVEWALKEAEKHKGFSFVEIMQPCLIFHNHSSYKKNTYSLEEKGHDKNNKAQALKRAEEFDYNGITASTKIPMGIFYQTKIEVFEDQLPILKKMKKEKIGFKDIKR